MQDLVFQSGLQNAIRQVVQMKAAAPEDLMSNALFQTRWAEVTKTRGDELIAEKLATGILDDGPDDDEIGDRAKMMVDSGLRGSKGLERCAPNTKDYWDTFAAQQVRQYVKLIIEPASSHALSTEIKNSALEGSFQGEANKSTVMVLLEIRNLQESIYRPMDRPASANQAVVSKLLAGVMAARGGAANEDGLYIAPGDGDVFFLCDGGRDTDKSALRGAW
jgi:hypothetical protein